MKTAIFTFFFSFFSGVLFAQEAEPALASISYEFIHTQDTSERDQPREEEMVVYNRWNVAQYCCCLNARV